jgi:hypothetical protein
MSIIIYLFRISTTNVFRKSRILKFLKRDCGTIPVAEIISGKIEIFSKLQRFLIATESSKYLLMCFLDFNQFSFYYSSIFTLVRKEKFSRSSVLM